jgi:hypothetical protein
LENEIGNDKELGQYAPSIAKLVKQVQVFRDRLSS